MKKLFLLACSAATLFVACNDKANQKEADSATPATEEVAKKPEWIPIDSAKQMEAWMKYGGPGDVHKMMAKSNGLWDCEMTHWMAKGAPAMNSKATCTNKMVMDGRYQVSEIKGDFGGMPFFGQSTTAYDNYTKKIQATWIDNMSTGVLNSEGSWDEATKSMTLVGKMTNPANGLECETKEIHKVIDDNTQEIEMYGPDPATGEQYKSMVIKMKKRS